MSKEYLGNMEFDVTRTVRDYEYTRKSVLNLSQIVDSQQFANQDSETIFRYLQNEMEIVSFGDYLKRYIYRKTGVSTPFADLDDSFYISVINDSFKMNRAPYAFKETTTRRSTTVKSWLRNASVRRSQVFLLGFGLGMDDKDVSDFLTKVLKEQDLRFNDPDETIYWHCFHCGRPYSYALAMQKYYAGIQPGQDTDPSFWKAVMGSLKIYLSNEDKLKEYLVFLKLHQGDHRDTVSREFKSLYDRAVQAAGKLLSDEEWFSKETGELIGSADGNYTVNPADIEAILCSGIPLTGSKNLSPINRSTLSGAFQKKRMSRQRISRIMTGKAEADRFDIITLLFLVYAITVEPDWPTERYMKYIDEANEILDLCNMMGIYPVNPYESFVLMCLLTEEPLSVYNDVWEMSYKEK